MLDTGSDKGYLAQAGQAWAIRPQWYQFGRVLLSMGSAWTSSLFIFLFLVHIAIVVSNTLWPLDFLKGVGKWTVYVTKPLIVSFPLVGSFYNTYCWTWIDDLVRLLCQCQSLSVAFGLHSIFLQLLLDNFILDLKVGPLIWPTYLFWVHNVMFLIRITYIPSTM